MATLVTTRKLHPAVEEQKIFDMFYRSYLGRKIRTTSKVVKLLLLNHDCWIVGGVWCELKTKSLGLGVYEVWLEEK